MKPRTVRKLLDSSLDHVALSAKDYVNPERKDKDFSRNRCISFRDVLAFPLSQGAACASKELPLFYHSRVPTASAFRQQRQKVSSAAFYDVFRHFTDACLPSLSSASLFHGYHLLAVDGSHIVSAPYPPDQDAYIRHKEGSHYNIHHLNALFSLSHSLYCDAEVQPIRHMNECGALAAMISRSSLSNVILLADRNYESYNILSLLQEKGWKFLFRIKDPASGSIASALSLPDQEEFIAPFHIALSRNGSYKNLFPNIPACDIHNHFKKIAPKNPFDLDFNSNGVFWLDFSIVRIKISDSLSETLITNLDFPIDLLKALYASRWGIETSFRHLKYSVSLLAAHAKKEELLLQEIFAALTLYNFSRLIASSITIHEKKRKLNYCVNFSSAVVLARKFLLNQIAPPTLESLLSRDLTPIRPGRAFPRILYPTGFVNFAYRLS